MTKIGEVLQASITGYTAQAYQLHQPPPLGSLVKTGADEDEVFSVVCNAYTQPIESSRYPLAMGEGMGSQEEIYQHHPQLLKLLHTRFETLTVGYRQGKRLYYLLPPKPPNIHHFVYLCHPEEVKEFSSSFQFLGLLLEANLPWRDEVVIACLRYLARHQPDGRRFLISAGKELVLRLVGEGQRLNSLLKGLASSL